MYKFDLEKDEQIIKKGMASFKDDSETLTGALYLTNKRLIFVGYLHGITFKSEKAVNLKQISTIIGCRTLFIIPNGIEITTQDGEHLSLSLTERDNWLLAIRHRISSVQS
jgi:hypothetical protein